MDILFSYQQEKLDKNTNSNVCNYFLKKDNNNIIFEGYYDFQYHRMDEPKQISYVHKFTLNIDTGDVTTTYEIKNSNLGYSMKTFKNCSIHKKNSFRLLYDLTENAIYRGEKRSGFWGVKYYQSVGKMVQIVYDILKPNIKSSYFLDKIKTPEKCYMNELYDLIVDYHLDKKGIKPHDSVYFHIQHEYPKKKWLKKNDNKFLAAVLDSYGIKSKYLIGKLNKWSGTIHIGSLNYMCKLFGDNYLSYLQEFPWEMHCYETPPNKRTHELKNDSEKKIMVRMINNWEVENIRVEGIVYSLNKLLSLRDELEKKGHVDLKFKAKNDTEFEILLSMWQGYKQYLNRGYKLKYEFPQFFIEDIEKPFEYNNETFKPQILVSEDDFRGEGFNMRNCMGNQFIHGLFSIFVSLQKGRKKINMQFRKGNLIQSYGKANTPIPKEFEEPIKIITERFKHYSQLTWVKTKYDVITH